MLKEKIIGWLEENDCLFEPTYPVSETGAKSTPLQFNLAGLICRAAGFTPQAYKLYFSRPPLSAPDVEVKWLKFEGLMSQGTRICSDDIDVYALARQLWAAEYGDEAARELPFYDVNQNVPGTMWWDRLAEVETEDLLAYLKGELTFRLNKHYGVSS